MGTGPRPPPHTPGGPRLPRLHPLQRHHHQVQGPGNTITLLCPNRVRVMGSRVGTQISTQTLANGWWLVASVHYF